MAKSTCLIALFVAVVVCAEAIRIDPVQPPSRRGKFIPSIKKDDPRCTKGNGLYPDPKDCTRYLKCVNGNSRERKCPENFKFDTVRHCVPPTDNPDCGKKTSHGPLDVDVKCPSKYGYFPLKSDCRKYMICVDGKPNVRDCPKNQVYIDNNGGCVARDECPQQQSAEKRICERANYNLPYEFNCRKYIKCVNFQPQRKDCPPGKAFDPKKLICTKEQLKKCQNNDILKVQQDE